MKPLLKITRQGVYASFQDNGRFGYRRLGVPVSGVMDSYSFDMGNKILNNPPAATSLEIFAGGFEMEAMSDHTYVLTGASGDCYINKIKIVSWKSFQLKTGDILSIKGARQGAIFYLIPQGGFQVEPLLRSRSTYPIAGIGESISENSILYGVQDVEPLALMRGLVSEFIPKFEDIVHVRVFRGPHFELFTEESRESLLTKSFQFVGGNRMGYYFKGGKLALRDAREIISEATQPGTIQVPASGDPIILMADAQTVGGYPIIGTVHEDDLSKVAQLRTFHTVKFHLMEDE